MSSFFRTIQIIILAAVLVGIAAFAFNPTFADGIYAEPPSLTKTVRYVSKYKGSRVTLKWSTSFVQHSDGTVAPASGYEIQYSRKKDFSSKKKILKGSGARSTTISLPKLNSRKKYKKYINKYYFRIRSYAEVNGKKEYSKWTKASRFKTVKIYAPAVIRNADVMGKHVDLKWDSPDYDIYYDGYVVCGKKTSDVRWKQRKLLETQDVRTYKDTVGYEQEYDYMTLAYRCVSTEDPRTLNNTSRLKALNDLQDQYKTSVTTEKLVLGIPEISCVFDKGKLIVSWNASDNAEAYHIEVSESESFDTLAYTENMAAIEDFTSYQLSIGSLKDNVTYYVRMKASAENEGNTYYSGYSDVRTAQYENLTYTIKFSGNGATDGTMSKYVAQEDQDVILPQNQFTREGYTFAGWSTVKGAVNKYRDENNVLKVDTANSVDVDWNNFQIGRVEFADKSSVRDLAEAGGSITLYACWKGSGVKAASDWAVYISRDDTFEYGLVTSSGKVSKSNSHSHCWFCKGGPQVFNCNALCAAAYQHGMGYFSKYWSGSTSPTPWKDRGFRALGKNYDPALIKRGDIICCYNGSYYSHVMMAASGDDVELSKRVIVNARGWGKGVCTQNMLNKLDNYKYYYVLRLEE